jgi:hypothetical protein
MPRIIDVDTEAFAPGYQKAYQEPREARADTELRRMGTKLQLANQVLPYVSEGIKGIDKFVVTPIQQYLKEGREEEYGKSGAGSELLEADETPMQKIARQRLEAQKSQKPFDTSAWEKEAEEMYDITKMPKSPELGAQRPEYVGGEELAQMFGEDRPSFGEYYSPEQEAIAERAEPRKEEKVSLRSPVVFRDPRTGALVPAERGALEQGSPAYAMEVSRQVTGMPRKRAAEVEKPEARRMPPHPMVEGIEPTKPYQPKYTEESLGAKAEGGFAGTEALAEPTQTAATAKAAAAPAAPKTLATASDDELKKARGRLETLVAQNPQDTEYARRLKQIDLELRHRGEQMEYEDWAARARAADTVEEQAKVLEMAKNVRMPVGGLQGLLKTGFERAKEAALGTREEKGLFPEVPRPVSDWEIKLKQANILYKEGLAAGLPEKQARDRATAILKMQQANVAAEKAETEAATREPKVIDLREAAQLKHAQEERLNAQTKAINEKLPNEIALMKSRSAALQRKLAGGGGKKDDLLKAIALQQKQDQELIKNIDGTLKGEQDTWQRIHAQADDDARDATKASNEYNSIVEAIKRAGTVEMTERERFDLRLRAEQARVNAESANKKAAASEAQGRIAYQNERDMQAKRAEAQAAARENNDRTEILWERYYKSKGLPLLAKKNPEVKKEIKSGGGAGGLITGIVDALGGGATTAPKKKGSDVDKFFND